MKLNNYANTLTVKGFDVRMKGGMVNLNDLCDLAEYLGYSIEDKSPDKFMASDEGVNLAEIVGNSQLGSQFIGLKYANFISMKFYIEVYYHLKDYQSSCALRNISEEGKIEMTAALKEYRTSKGKETAFYHYVAECDLVNVTVLGCTAKQFRKFHNIPDADAIRDYMSPLQIKAIHYIQSVNTFLIEEGFTPAERREKLKSRFDTKYSAKIKAEMDKLLESM